MDGPTSLPGALGSGFFRGFISGLGLVHLAAGVADLRSLTQGLEGPRRDLVKSE